MIITDSNRNDITNIYCRRLLDDMDFNTLWTFAYDMLKDSKNEYNNEQLTTEISDYYPDLLEN
jgi:hypothetical protein